MPPWARRAEPPTRTEKLFAPRGITVKRGVGKKSMVRRRERKREKFKGWDFIANWTRWWVFVCRHGDGEDEDGDEDDEMVEEKRKTMGWEDEMREDIKEERNKRERERFRPSVSSAFNEVDDSVTQCVTTTSQVAKSAGTSLPAVLLLSSPRIIKFPKRNRKPITRKSKTNQKSANSCRVCVCVQMQMMRGILFPLGSLSLRTL